MERFSLDDVAEHFRADVRGVLASLAESVGALAAPPGLMEADAPALSRRLAAGDDACHTILGSSSLVAARSLVAGAGALRRLLAAAREPLAEVASAGARLRLLAGEAQRGISLLERLLDLELGHRRREADAVAATIAARVHAALAGRASDDDAIEFDFSDDADGGAELSADAYAFADTDADAQKVADPAPVAADDDLGAIFAGEVAEFRPLLARSLDAFAAGDRRVLGELERIYHTIAGGAATVGLPAVAVLARELRAQIEAAAVAADAPDAAAATGLREASNRLLAAIGVPALPAAPAPTSTADDDLALREIFAQEAAEILDTVDRLALGLDDAGAPGPLLADLMRAYHTLKGSANTVGATTIGKVAHVIEDHLAEIQRGATAVARAAVVGVLLRVQQDIRVDLRRFVAAAPPAEALDARAIGAALDQARPPPAGEGSAPPAGAAAGDDAAVAEPAGDDAGDRRIVRVPAERLDRLMGLAGELVVNRARLNRRVAELAALQRELRASRARLLDTVDGFRERHEFSGLDGDRGRPLAGAAALRAGLAGAAPATASALSEQFSALELDRYDDIHILARSLSEISGDIGELQTQIAGAIADFGEDADGFGRIAAGIQGEITHARLVPLGQLFTRLRLAVRDAAAREGKTVRLVTSGEDVALDKAIVDGIHAPLLHLVRNAVAHGIESGERRAAAGKDAAGTITLVARQDAGQIAITISDDGGGLDLAKLHRRGVELGLIAAAAPSDSDAVRELVFVPGLSTSAQVGEVAGRGFGCDVARRDVQNLSGGLRLAGSGPAGTAFLISLPLTLAITRALMLELAGRRFAVPMNFIERVIDLEAAVVARGTDGPLLAWADTQVPLLDGAAVLGLAEPAPAPWRGPALVLRIGDERWALRVDGLLTQEEIVVSSLGELLAGHPLFTGVTITGSGTLVPIIDVAGVVGQRTVQDPPTLPAVIAPPSPAPPQASAMRILFVDDSLSVRKVAERQLRELGAEVTLAVDGEDALGKLRQTSFDLVFTDLEMPRMHGYDLIRNLRFIPAYAALPVVVVTSRSAAKHRELARAVGANGYLTKPFTSDQLRQALAGQGPRP